MRGLADEADAIVSTGTGETAAETEPLIGTIDPAWRIFVPPVALDRDFWRFLALVTLIYALGLALLIPSFEDAVQEQARRRGQVDDPKSISVELVEDPEKPPTARHGAAAADSPTPPAPPAPPPVPPQPAATEPVEPLRPTQPPDDPQRSSERDNQAAAKPSTQPAGETTAETLGIDLTMGRYSAALDAYIEQRRREKAARQASPPRTAMLSGSSSVRGAPSSGQSDAYSRSVIAALLRARPPPFALRGEVMVSFEISPSGGIVYVHVINSSGNKAMDAEAVAAIRRARFDAPPPGKTRRDLTYIIHFVFE